MMKAKEKIAARILADDKVTFGFWIYLMTDCLIFASLFAVYVVQRSATAGGPTSNELFDLPFVLGETMLLLTSSFVCGLMLLAAQAYKKHLVIAGLIVTGLLGAGFLTMEIIEFAHLIGEGYSWQRSGFLTAFFTLVGTHGLHILVGMLWLIVMIYRVARVGITPATLRKLTLFSMFWHFLDVIWIFIFTIVYMIGVL
jgi:cytochrome o ubiquinol oxidase subunit 3